MAAALVAIAAVFVPFVANGYWLSIAVTGMMYIAQSTSWALFSGPTHYISLATGAFFGIGGYLVGAGMSDYQMPFWLMAMIGPAVATTLAALIGITTLRLSGVYFVIFTLGLAEMIRNLVSWVQNNFLGSRGLYVLTDLRDQHIYWMLLAVAVTVYLVGWVVNRSRIGFALRIIGGDETVAKHVGINTATAKKILFRRPVSLPPSSGRYWRRVTAISSPTRCFRRSCRFLSSSWRFSAGRATSGVRWSASYHSLSYGNLWAFSSRTGRRCLSGWHFC